MPEYKVIDNEHYPNKRALIIDAANSTQARRKACKIWNLKINDRYYGASSLKIEKITNVSLEGKTVCFFFNTTNCFKEKSGQCSLFASEEFLKQFEDNPNTEKANPYHCCKVAKLVEIRDPLLFPIYLYKHKCGHYQSGSGLHRTCIAGHLKIEVPINLEEEPHSTCTACTNPEEKDILIKF